MNCVLNQDGRDGRIDQDQNSWIYSAYLIGAYRIHPSHTSQKRIFFPISAVILTKEESRKNANHNSISEQVLDHQRSRDDVHPPDRPRSCEWTLLSKPNLNILSAVIWEEKIWTKFIGRWWQHVGHENKLAFSILKIEPLSGFHYFS